jgi:hypothetical protein
MMMAGGKGDASHTVKDAMEVIKNIKESSKEQACEGIGYDGVIRDKFGPNVNGGLVSFMLIVLFCFMGPGVSIFLFAYSPTNPCINRNSTIGPVSLWWSIIGLYTGIMTLMFVRSCLYVYSVLFCKKVDAKIHMAKHLCLYLVAGIVLNMYNLYVALLSVWALILCAVFIILGVFTLFPSVYFEYHTRHCTADHEASGVHLNKRWVKSLETFIFLSWISLGVVCFALDWEVSNSAYRPSGDCDDKIWNDLYWSYCSVGIFQFLVILIILITFIYSVYNRCGRVPPPAPRPANKQQPPGGEAAALSMKTPLLPPSSSQKPTTGATFFPPSPASSSSRQRKPFQSATLLDV